MKTTNKVMVVALVAGATRHLCAFLDFGDLLCTDDRPVYEEETSSGIWLLGELASCKSPGVGICGDYGGAGGYDGSGSGGDDGGNGNNGGGDDADGHGARTTYTTRAGVRRHYVEGRHTHGAKQARRLDGEGALHQVDERRLWCADAVWIQGEEQSVELHPDDEGHGNNG